jgi:hypothetical protein
MKARLEMVIFLKPLNQRSMHYLLIFSKVLPGEGQLKPDTTS